MDEAWQRQRESGSIRLDVRGQGSYADIRGGDIIMRVKTTLRKLIDRVWEQEGKELCVELSTAITMNALDSPIISVITITAIIIIVVIFVAQLCVRGERESS